MKKTIIILSAVFGVIIFSIYFLVLSVKNSVDCSQLVIDSYEIHSGINIPSVDFVNCYYDKELNTRISVYDLKKNMDMEKFIPLDNSLDYYIKGNGLLASVEQPSNSELYVATGEKWGRKWTYLVDEKSNRLWVEMNYSH